MSMERLSELVKQVESDVDMISAEAPDGHFVLFPEGDKYDLLLNEIKDNLRVIFINDNGQPDYSVMKTLKSVHGLKIRASVSNFNSHSSGWFMICLETEKGYISNRIKKLF